MLVTQCYIPNKYTAFQAAISHWGYEYSMPGIDVAHTEKGVTGLISPVPITNISLLLFIKTALAF